MIDWLMQNQMPMGIVKQRSWEMEMLKHLNLEIQMPMGKQMQNQKELHQQVWYSN